MGKHDYFRLWTRFQFWCWNWMWSLFTRVFKIASNRRTWNRIYCEIIFLFYFEQFSQNIVLNFRNRKKYTFSVLINMNIVLVKTSIYFYDTCLIDFKYLIQNTYKHICILHIFYLNYEAYLSAIEKVFFFKILNCYFLKVYSFSKLYYSVACLKVIISHTACFFSVLIYLAFAVVKSYDCTTCMVNKTMNTVQY